MARVEVFNISNDYRVATIIGLGAYGVVCSAIHIPTNTRVAIKRIEPFQKPLFCIRTLREIKLLRYFRRHENIIGLHAVQKPRDFASFNEVYLIQEYMPSDLHRVIHGNLYTDDHIQYFVYQLLRGLKYIHLANVIHRDLKPSNILVNESCDLKICDFGLARVDNPTDRATHDPTGMILALTEYVATRWYRAPEIMLTLSQYSTAVDMWLVGCILAELFIGVPLFPGRDYRHQLILIFQLLGTPQGADYESICSQRAKDYIHTLPRYSAVNMDTFFNSHYNREKRFGGVAINPLGLDMLRRLLVFDPNQRMSVTEALNHPYVSMYHDPSDEPSCEPIDYEEFQTSSTELTNIWELKRLLYNQVMI